MLKHSRVFLVFIGLLLLPLAAIGEQAVLQFPEAIKDKHAEIGIFILIPEDLQGSVKKLNQQLLTKIQADPHQANAHNTFHISLFQERIAKKDIAKLADDLQNLLSHIQPFDVFLSSGLEDTGQNVFWNVNKSQPLQDLHEQILKIALPFRKGLMQQYQLVSDDPHTSLTVKEKLEKFGTDGVLQDFKPHITVYYGSGQNSHLTETLKQNHIPQAYHFPVKQLGIGYLGFEGNVMSIIKIFSFNEQPQAAPQLSH